MITLKLIAIFIWISSFFGLIVIIFRKIPVLVTLPELEPKKERENLISRLKRSIKKINPFKSFSYEIFLQKILSKIRILSLKAENRTFNWLQKLREKSKKKYDDYWEKLKKSTKNRPE